MRSKSIFLATVLLTAAPGARADEPLGADELVATVLRNSARLRAATLESKAAQFSADAAGRFEGPMLSYGVAPLNLGGHQAEIAQTLPWPGKQKRERAMAESESGMQVKRLVAAREEAAARARELYAERVALLNDHDAFHDEMLRIEELKRMVLAALAQGKASQADVLAVESEVHMVHEREIETHFRLRRTHAAIDALAGVNIAERLGGTLPPQAAPITTPAMAPALEAAHLESETARRRAEVEKRAGYPDITLFAGLNTMWDMRNDWVMAGVRLTLPAPSRRASNRAAEAQAGAAEAMWEEERRMRQQEINEATADWEEAGEKIELFEKTSVPLSRQRLEAAHVAYANGLAGVAEIMDALRANVEARRSLYRMRADQYKAAVQLALARGQTLIGSQGGTHE